MNSSGHVYTMEEDVIGQRTGRRCRHSTEFKAQALTACMQPGVSIAGVALHYRLNANLLRRWVADQEEQDLAAQARQAMTASPAEFVPLQLSGPAVPVAQDIVMEVRHGAAQVTVRWPSSAAGHCATWLQGWLR